MKEETYELCGDYKFAGKAEDALHEILKIICIVCPLIPPRAKPVITSASELVKVEDNISRVIEQNTAILRKKYHEERR